MHSFIHSLLNCKYSSFFILFFFSIVETRFHLSSKTANASLFTCESRIHFSFSGFLIRYAISFGNTRFDLRYVFVCFYLKCLFYVIGTHWPLSLFSWSSYQAWQNSFQFLRHNHQPALYSAVMTLKIQSSNFSNPYLKWADRMNIFYGFLTFHSSILVL